MAIRYPSAGTIYYTQFSCTSVQTICDGIKDALVACGWQSTSMPSKVILTFTGVPNNNDTCSLGGLTYTFKTSINNSNAREVFIGASASACATNLAEAINAGSGSGTDYSSATTAAGTFTASAASGVLTITTVATGFSANSQLSFTEGLNNASFTTIGSSDHSTNRGYMLVMPVTPQGLCASVLIEDTGRTDYVRIRGASADGITSESTEGNWLSDTASRVAGHLAVSGGRTLEFCGNAHQFFIFLLGDATTASTKVAFGVPHIRDAHVPFVITNASNASPIEITTSTDHGWSSGDHVFVADVQGNTAANGFWVIVVTGSNKLTLTGSTGNGAYTSSPGTYYSGGVIGTNDQITRAIWMTGDNVGGHRSCFRNALGYVGSDGDSWHCLNQFHWSNTQSNIPFIIIPKNAGNNSVNSYGVNPEWGNKGDITEPAIGWRLSSSSSSAYRYGQLWAAFVHLEPMPMDRLNTGFDGHNWINITNGATAYEGSLWLAKS
jgi:hypothetical protein